jgi:CTP:molybdopterin cytidylyltransferase MocA
MADSKLAPHAGKLVATPASEIPLNRIKLPPGFKAEIWASGMPGARAMVFGDNGKMYIGTRGIGRVYEVTDNGKERTSRVVVDKLVQPAGVEYRDGSLYVMAINKVLRFDGIATNPNVQPVDLTEKFNLPPEQHHNWKYIRFGPDNKLLADLAGSPLIVRLAVRLLASRASEVVVVTGYDRDRVEAALAGLQLRLVYNPAHERGMGRSIATGVGALSPRVRGALICPGDMPGLGPSLIDRLIDAFERSGREAIVHPVLADGSQVNPVLWPRRFFPRLEQLSGGIGAKPLLRELASDIVRVAGVSAEDVLDIDTMANLQH